MESTATFLLLSSALRGLLLPSRRPSRSASIMERRAGEAIHHRVRREGDEDGLAGFRAAEPERIATFDNDGTLWASSRCISSCSSRSTASRRSRRSIRSGRPKEPFAAMLRAT